MIPVSDPVTVLLVWLALTVVGLGLASIYHAAVAKAASPTSPMARPLALWPKVLGMAAVTYLGIGIIVGVSLMAASVVTLITPFLGTGVAFLGFTILFWLVVYLIFTPHGLVRYRLGLVSSMRESVRIVRGDFFTVVGLLVDLGAPVVGDRPGVGAAAGGVLVQRCWPSSDTPSFRRCCWLPAMSSTSAVGKRWWRQQRPAPAPDETTIDRRDARGV